MYCDLEPATFYVVKEVVSRKEHKCCECRSIISIGELYLNCRIGWDGTAETFKQHTTCARACEYARDHLLEECLPYGGLIEWWDEENNSRHQNKKDPAWKEMRRLYAAVLRLKRKPRKP